MSRSNSSCELRFNLVNLPMKSESSVSDSAPSPLFVLPGESEGSSVSMPFVHYVSEHDYSGRIGQVQVPPVHTVVDSPFVQSPGAFVQSPGAFVQSPDTYVQSPNGQSSHAVSSQFPYTAPVSSPIYETDQSVYTQQQHSMLPAPSPQMFAQSPLTVEGAPHSFVYTSEDSNDSVVQSVCTAPRDTASQRGQQKTIHRYIIVQPGEDGEKATADAINDIAESLNREAAEKLARGQTPEKETVIEVTRIQSPADGYFSRENFLKNRVSRPVAPNVSALSSTANRLDLDHRTPEKALVGSHGSRQQRSSHSVKHSNDSRWYRTPTPPRMGDPAYIDSSDSPQSCYFNGASEKGFIYKTQHHNTAPCTQTASSLLAAASGVTDDSQTLNNTDDSQIHTDSDEPRKLNDSLTNMQWLEAMSNSSNSGSAAISNRRHSQSIKTERDPVPSVSLNLAKGVAKQTGNHRDSRLLATDKQIEKISRECGRKKRPPFSYMHLIQMAICSKEDRKMTLKQIYQWIEDKFPYYKFHPSQGWRNSIRHNLSLYDIFVREKPNVPGQTGCSYWTLRSESDHKPSSKLKHSSLLADAPPDMSASSPVFLRPPSSLQQTPVVVMPSLAGFEQTDQLNLQTSKCSKKGPVPLLPKPGPVQAYALIPIQGGVPVIPPQPMLVQSMGMEGKSSSMNSTYSSLDGSLSKDPLKRNRSPSNSGAPKKKLPKLLAKPNILSSRSKIRTNECNDSVMSTDSGVSFASSRNSTNSSVNLSQSHSQASFLSRQDSGIDIRSLSRSLSDSGSGNSTEVSEGLPKPKMYNRRKSKLVPKCMKDEARSPSDSIVERPHFYSMDAAVYASNEEAIHAFNDSSMSDRGIQEILASIEEDLSSPIRNLLKTPPKGVAKNLLTSTPFGGAMNSPSWLSPIRLLTPLTGDANKDTCIITPASATSSAGRVATSTPYRLEGTPSPSYFTRVRNSTPRGLDASPQLKGFTPCKLVTDSPLCFRSTERSPRVGSLRALGIPGLTPLKSPSHAHAVNSHSPNDSFSMTNQSFTKLFGEFHLDSMLEEGINMDVGNFSFSALQ